MSRLLLALLVVAALLLAPATAFAQDSDSPVFCGDLSDDDCQVLLDSHDAMSGLSSYTLGLTTGINLDNLPNLPAALGVTVSMDGDYLVNPDIIARAAELQNATPDDPTQAMMDMLGLVSDIYSDVSFDVVTVLSTTDDMNDLINAQPGMTFELPSKLTLPIRMVDGKVYFEATEVGEAINEPDLAGWVGVDLATAFTKSAEQAIQQLQENPEALDTSSLEAAAQNMELNKTLSELAKKYTTVERLDDATLDGVDVAQFAYKVDVAGFVSSPEFMSFAKEMMAQQMKANKNAMPMSEADAQAAIEMLPMLAPMLLSNMEYERLVSIGLDDSYVYQSDATIDWDLSTVASMASAMQSGKAQRPAPGAEPAVFHFSLQQDYSNFGEEFDIEAPEDAIMVPLDGMQQPLPAM